MGIACVLAGRRPSSPSKLGTAERVQRIVKDLSCQSITAGRLNDVQIDCNIHNFRVMADLSWDMEQETRRREEAPHVGWKESQMLHDFFRGS